MQFAQAGRISDATGIFRRILEIAPGHVGSLFQMGVFAHRAGDNATAEPFFLRAVATDPKSVAAHFNLGRSQLSLRKYEEALGSFCRVLDLDPALAEASVCLALALQGMDRNDEAASALRQAIAVRPGYAEAHMNLGNLLKEQGKLSDAERHARRAIALAPGLATAHRNLAVILQDQGLADGAIKSFEAASRLAPNWPDPHSGLLFCLNYDARRTAEAIAAEHLRRGKLWTGTPRAPDNFADHDRAPDRRLRIGYVSGDFHRHPVGIFMSRILESHDPAQVESFAYSTGLARIPSRNSCGGPRNIGAQSATCRTAKSRPRSETTALIFWSICRVTSPRTGSQCSAGASRPYRSLIWAMFPPRDSRPWIMS